MASRLMSPNVGDITKKLRNMASPTITWLGGIVWSPRALRVSDSTITMRVKLVSMISSAGATASSVMSTMISRLWLGFPPMPPRSRLTDARVSGAPAVVVSARAGGAVAPATAGAGAAAVRTTTVVVVVGAPRLVEGCAVASAAGAPVVTVGPDVVVVTAAAIVAGGFVRAVDGVVVEAGGFGADDVVVVDGATAGADVVVVDGGGSTTGSGS